MAELQFREPYRTIRKLKKGHTQFEFKLNINWDDNKYHNHSIFGELMHYTIFIIAKTNYIDLFPQLIKDFLAHYNYNSMYDESMIKFLKALEQIIQIHPKPIDPRLINYILVIIGLLPLDKRIINEISPDFFNVLDYSNYQDRMQEDIMYDLELSGLVKVLLSFITRKDSSWHAFVQNCEEITMVLLLRLLKEMEDLDLRLSDKDFNFIMEMIDLDDRDSKNIIHQITKVLNFDRLLKFMGIIQNRLTKNDMIRILNNSTSKNRIQSLEEISSVLQSIQMASNDIKDVCYDSEITKIIRRNLNYFKGHVSSLGAFREIFVQYKDDYILSEVNQKNLAETILSSSKCSLSDTLEIMDLEEEDYLDLVTIWINKKLLYYCNKHDVILEINNELSLLKYKENSAKMFIEYLWNHSIKRKFDIIDLLPIMNETSTAIKDELLGLICKEIIPSSTEAKKMKIIRLNEENPENEFIMTVFTLVLPPPTDLSIKKVQQELIRNPTRNQMWGILLNNYKKHKKNEYTKRLVDSISQLGRQIIARDIKINTLNRIKQFNAVEREDYVWYFERSFAAMKIQENFKDSLEFCINKSDNFCHKIRILRDFLDHLCREIQNFDQLFNMVEESTDNYEELKVSQIGFNDQIVPYVKCAKKIYTVLFSAVFKNVYIPEQGVDLSIGNIIDVSTAALDRMVTELGTLMGDLESFQMQRFIQIFSTIQDVNREVTIINNLIRPQNINDLRNSLEFYFNINFYIDSCNNVLALTNLFGFTDDVMNTICNTFLHNCETNINALSVGQFYNICLTTREELIEDMTNDEYNIVMGILKELIGCSDLIDFIYKLKEEELEHMKESVNDYEEELYVDTQIVFNLENIYHFIRNMQITCYSDFIQYARHTSQEDYRNLVGHFRSCIAQLNGIIDLHRELNCKEEAKKKQIQEIYQNSRYELIKEKKGFKVKLQYLSNQKFMFFLEDLMELKDRASLIMNATEEEEEVKFYRGFVDFINTIQSIIKSLNELQLEGYPHLDLPETEFVCRNGDFASTSELETNLAHSLTNWKNQLKEAYKQHSSLTYLFGRQFWILEKYLLTKEKKRKAKNLLQFMGKQTKNLPKFEMQSEETSMRLNILGEYLDNLPNIHRNFYKLDKEPIITQEDREVLYINNPDYLKSIVSLYLNSGLQLPKASQIFYSRLDIHTREIDAFLYRCFNSPEELFVLVNGENLLVENQNYFRTLFHQLCFENPDFYHFKLALITSDPNSPLIRYFKYHEELKFTRLRDSKMLEDQEIVKIIQEIETGTLVVTSKASGLGKTHWIHKQNTGKVVDFPISGNIDTQRIGERLSSLNIPPRYALNLQIGYIDKPEVLNEILISLTLFRIFNYMKDIFVVPNNLRIYIEIANTFQERLIDSIQYVRYLRHKHIERFKLDKLDPSDDHQFICNYLERFATGEINQVEIDEYSFQEYSIPEIHGLLQEYFLNQNEEPTYTQLAIFTKVLTYLLRNFRLCYFFSLDALMLYSEIYNFANLTEEFSNLRSVVIEGLVLTTQEFTTKSIKNTRDRQDEALGSPRGEDLEANFSCNLTWESSNHFNLIILPDGSTMPIYREQAQVNRNIRKLIYITEQTFRGQAPDSDAISSGNFQITEYASLNHLELLEKLKIYKGQDLPSLYYDSEYVITPDNFLKMNLIYLRVNSGVPVVIMGETGCGKTSLVRFLVENVLEQELRTVSIHAGIYTSDIIEIVQKLVITAYELMNQDKQLWVFFDEFNTSESIATICEILCKWSIEGTPLPDNMHFVGACNPYRKIKKTHHIESVGIKRAKEYISESQKLVHTVYPLPSSIIDYVWDFGALTESDMKKYVRSMLRELDSHILDHFVEMVCYSHAYFQRKEDKSSVSLRDVARFLILYKWFKNSIALKQQNRNQRFYQNLRKYKVTVIEYPADLSLTAGIMALCHCYYLRLSSQKRRNRYLSRIQIVTGNFLDSEYILRILENEQTDYLARMELPEGTALNLALKENIFAMIPCIINKIPIFVCGKPGCSKSLAIQLIFANLRGDKSADDYFKKLAELIMVPFQGSDSCTSQGIIKVFERAKKYLETEQSDPSKQILLVVVFDEIGLAEISKHNPLKVLHGLLELENRKVGFVGISNWRLDASKMNRALYLARPDPEEQDLMLTAMSIYSSYSKENEEHRPIIESLALAYNQLKQHFKNTPFADFYGLRDFYHLIKQVSKKLIHENIVGRQDEAAVAKKAIQRNFGGTIRGADIMGEFFTQIYYLEGIYAWVPNAPVDKLILENLSDKDSRYLMLIGRGDVMTYLLNKCLKDTERRVFVGSNLENDTNQEEYGFRSISDIMLYIERGVSVILNDMDHIYSSLYDLFNQNFAVSGERRYCRIALGAHFNPRCFVHENFHAIVLQDEDEVSLLSADPPFLNRFEKHNLTLDHLLKERHREAVCHAEEWVDSLIKNEMCVHITNIFPIFSTQTLALLALDSSEEDILAYIKRQLLKIAPSDILILADNADMDYEEKDYIKYVWKEAHCLTFNETVRNMLEGEFNKMIALTYDHEISGSILGEDLKGLIYHTNISSFKSEQDLRKDILGFYRSSKKQVYLMEIDLSKEGKHLRLLEFMFNSLEDETKGKWKCNKVVCLVVHMMRNIKYEKSLVMMESWEMRMFDNLGHSSFELSDEFLMLSTRKLLLDDEFVPFHSVIRNLTEKCILNFKYEVNNTDPSFTKNHMYLIFENIEKDERLIDTIRAKVLNLARQRNLKDWKTNVFYDTDAVLDSGNLFIAIRAVIEKELEKLYNPIVYVLEYFNAFTSYFTDFDRDYSPILREIWIQCFNRTSNEQNIRMLNTSQNAIVHIDYPLYFPFFQLEYTIILNTYKEQSRENNEFFVNNFIANYRENSKFSEFLEDIERDEQLKNLFLRDFIRIKLHENRIDLRYEDFILNIHRSMADEGMCLEEELILVIENEKMLAIICKITDVFSDILRHSVTDEFELNRDENIKEKFTAVLEKLILDVFPTKQNTWDGFAKYLGKIEIVFNLLFALKNYDIEPNNIRILEFWVSLILLLLKAKCKESYIYKIVKNTPNDFISRQDYREYLLGQLSNLSNCSDSMIYEFKAFYYILILEHSCECIEDIAQECETTEIWKYFSKLTDFILDNSGLTDEILDLIDENEENQDGDFHLPDNDFMEHIEAALAKTGLTSRFAVLLSDTIFKFTSKFNQDSGHQEILSGLESQYFCYQFFLRHNSLDDPQYPLIKRLVCSTVLKDFLAMYSYALINEGGLSQEQYNIIDEVSVSLEENQTFQLYCIKTIHKLMKYNDSELSALISNRKREVRWLNTFDMLQPRNNLDSFPFIKDMKEEYKESLILCNMIRNEHVEPNAIERLIRRIDSSRQRLSFGLAFMNQIFTLFYIEDSMDAAVVNWFNANRELIENQLGLEFCLLINSFVNNFPSNTFMHLKRATSQEDFYKILGICQIFIIIISHNREMSPLTDVFFENGSISRNFANRFNSKYVFGVESNPLHEYLVSVSQNFDSHLTKSKSANICGDNCDYIYFIEDCGRAAVESTCPYCKQRIGGAGHKLVERSGHRMIAHIAPRGDEPNVNQGKNLLAQLIQKYENQVVRGRCLYGFSCTDFYPRGLRHLSYKMLHLMLNSSLYMAMTLGLTDQNSLRNIFQVGNNDYLRFFEENIKFDFRRLYELLGTQEPQLWVFQALSQLPGVIDHLPTDANTPEARNQFEKLFEDSIKEYNESPVSAVRVFKETLRDEFSQGSSLLDYVQEMRMDEESYPCLGLFRMNEFPDLMKIENAFDIHDRKEEFLVLEAYLKNQADINSLTSFYPIIHFTNVLLDKFNHRITREEARETPMSEVLRENPELQALFDQFLESWNSLGITNLQHGCTFLEKIDFSYDTELIYFLVDNQEKGGGLYMTAMLKELAKVQNKLHFEFFKAISTSRKITTNFIADDSYHTIQSIKQENIILPVIDQALINLCSINNPDYGKGNEIVYSFDRLQKNLIKSLMNKKRLDAEKVYLVQYQFELLSIEGEGSGLLSHIRHSIEQKPLTDQASRELARFFKDLKLKEKDNYTITLREIYGSLEYILSLLKNIREEGQLTIIEFTHKIKSARICALLKKKNAISSTKLENIVALYEDVEKEYFPYMENLIRLEFRREDKKEEVEALMKRFEGECARDDELPNPEDLRTAVMRLIIRCLVAGLNPELQMSLYIYKEDFWDPSLEHKLDELEERFPKEILLSDAYVAYKSLDKPKAVQNQQPESIKQRPAERVSRKNLKQRSKNTI